MTATEEAAEWVEAVVGGVGATPDEDILQRQYVMILAERGGSRLLPIWIGPSEATVLAMALESVEMPRPFAYKLAAGLVEAAGSRITEVKITRLLDKLYYASVVVEGPGGTREVDARPSDAVNLAVASGAPIRVNCELLTTVAAHADDGDTPRTMMTTADIAAEARHQQEAALRRAQSSGPQPEGGPQDTGTGRPAAS